MLHDLQRDVLVREAGNVGLSAMHGSLLWSLAKRCCGVLDVTTCGGFRDVDWSTLLGLAMSHVSFPVSDVVAYAVEHLSYHLGAMCDAMISSGSSSVQVDDMVIFLSDARHALVHGVAWNVSWLIGRCVCGGGSVAGVDGDVVVAERVLQRELSCRGGSSSMFLDDAAALKAALRVLGWVRRALELCGLVIRRDVGRCASYLWASLEPVMRCCDDDGAQHLLGDVVCALDVCRRSACVDGGGGWLAVSSVGEMSAASALVQKLEGHTKPVTCVVVGCMESSGRRCLVSGSADRTLRVWDVDTFECIHELRGHSGEVRCVSDVFVGGDGRHMVASGSGDKSVRVWDVGSGTFVRVLEGHSESVNGLSSMFVDTAGCRCVASALLDGSICVSDVESGACVGVMNGHGDAVRCVSVIGTVDGRQLLASGSDDRTGRLWDVASLECVRVLHGHGGSVTCVSCVVVGDSDRVLVASGSCDCTVRLWDVRTGEGIYELSGHSSGVTSVSSRIINPDGCRLLASGSLDGSMRLWNVASGKCVSGVLVASDGRLAVSDGFDGGGSVGRVLVATGTEEDGDVRVWDVRSILQSQSSRGSDRGVTVTCVSNSFDYPDSGRCVVASGRGDGSVALWDVDSGGYVGVLPGHTEGVTCVSSAFIASGRQLLASCSADKTVRLWDVTTVGRGQCYRVLTGHKKSVTSVSSGFVDGTGRITTRMLIASGSIDRTVRLWDVDTGMCLRVLNLKGHSSSVGCVSECYSGIGSGRRLIASGSDDETVRVWDVDTGECVRVLSGHCNLVTSVSTGIVDGSGRQLLASATWETIRLWDAVAGECVRVLKGHSGMVRCVTSGFVDGSGRHCIASTGSDGTLRVWDVSTGAAVSLVSPNEEMGFSCTRDAGRVSIVSSGGKCRLAIVAGGRLVVVEQLTLARAVVMLPRIADDQPSH
jgi:WD40 repeat protein